eukprot:SAG11_NODE_16849_length_535_cov_1.174312_1_plen_71_part_10
MLADLCARMRLHACACQSGQSNDVLSPPRTTYFPPRLRLPAKSAISELLFLRLFLWIDTGFDQYTTALSET